MIKSRRFWGACYYCVCTACNAINCPFNYKLYRCCYRCHERGTRSPRLYCDYFTHYLKSKCFKFSRHQSGTQRAGTYVLNVRGVCFVGRWSELRPIADRLGGELKPLGAIDFLTGDH